MEPGWVVSAPHSDARSMLRASAVAACLVLATLPARADSCALVIDGAQMGPSPNFGEWRWTSACYVTWPGGYVGQQNARDIYATKCKSLPGFLHFEGDYGSNRNTCIFSAPAAGPADEPDQTAEAPKEEINLFHVMSTWRLRSRNPSDLAAAREKITQAEQEYARKRFDDAEVYFGWALEYLPMEDRNPEVARLGAYAACMSALPTLTKFTQDGIAKPADVTGYLADCGQVEGDLLQKGIPTLRAAFNESERKRHQALAAQAPVVPAPPGADSRCLVFRDPHDTRVGCAKGKSWLMTHIGVARDKSLACPDPVRFRYVDETGEQAADAPTTLQTCGDPPRNVRVGK